MKHNIKIAIALSLLASLSACSSRSNLGGVDITSANAPSYKGMYLRGVFNWWEAQDQFKLVQIEDSVYSASIELIADGQPYDFKVVDDSWTANLNCGQAGTETLVIDESVILVCQENSLNLKFVPSATGVFTFTLDARDGFFPELTVSANPR